MVNKKVNKIHVILRDLVENATEKNKAGKEKSVGRADEAARAEPLRRCHVNKTQKAVKEPLEYVGEGFSSQGTASTKRLRPHHV